MSQHEKAFFPPPFIFFSGILIIFLCRKVKGDVLLLVPNANFKGIIYNFVARDKLE